MIVLGIESSCDDTGVGLVWGRPGEGATVLANVVASQAVHARYGGVMPEFASREHTRAIDPTLEAALAGAGLTLADLGAVAATRGPGLAGSLLVGLSYAKALAFGLEVPFYAMHHLEGHIQAALAAEPGLEPPYLALVVSGGHTHLFDVSGPGRYAAVGATRDDAAGEAYDKVARLLGLGFPGGPAVAGAAEGGDPFAVPFSVPLHGQAGYDFSFSGLKTAARLAIERGGLGVPDLAASFQRVVVESLVSTTARAARNLGRSTLVVAGGVAANRALREAFQVRASREGWRVLFPPPGLNTDNGAMIALAGYVRAVRGDAPDPFSVGVEPYLPLAGG